MKHGEKKRETLKKVKYVIGGAEWYKSAVQMFNPNASYHFCKSM